MHKVSSVLLQASKSDDVFTYREGNRNEGSKLACLFVRNSHFTVRVMRCGVPSGSEVRKELMEMKHVL